MRTVKVVGSNAWNIGDGCKLILPKRGWEEK